MFKFIGVLFQLALEIAILSFLAARALGSTAIEVVKEQYKKLVKK